MTLRPTSDLGALMQSAMEEYNETTRGLKKDYDQTMEARSISDVQAYVTSHAEQFKMFRHDGSRLDRFRTAIGDNLAQIQLMSDVFAAPTTAAFPAAAPIFTAINFLIFTGNKVQSDFDHLMGFLQEVGACMNSISIVEGFVHSGRRIPQLDGNFQKVFVAVLQLCGVSTKYISDGRWKRGLMKGFFNNDRGLSWAYSNLQKGMVELGRSIQNGTFAGMVVVTEAMGDLKNQVAELGRLARETNQATKEINDIVKESRDDIEDIRDSLRDQKMPDARRVRTFFEGFAFWEATFEERRRKFVNGTAEWLLDNDEVYKTWFAESAKRSWGRGLLSVLWIWGATGTGKSMLAYKMVDTLKISAAEEGRGASVIYYFFGAERKETLKSVLKSLIIQIADYDELYRQRTAELIKASSKAKGDDMTVMAMWKKYIADQFVTGSARGVLHIVLDGIEELSDGDGKVLHDIVGQIILDKLRIKIVLFGQSELNDTFGKIANYEVPSIEVTPDRIESAIKTLVEDRVSDFQVTLEDSLKDEVITRLSTGAKGFAFVDACLKVLMATEEAEDIRSNLDTLPSDFMDLLKRVLDRIASNIKSNPNQQDRLNAIKILIYWVAMTSSLVSVKELKCVLAMETKYKTFDVVRLVRGTCAGLLWIQSEEENQEAADEDKVAVLDAEKGIDHKQAQAITDEAILNSFVKFREPRFEDCMQNIEWSNEIRNELVEDARVAKFQLAMTAMRVLSCPKSDPLYEVSRNLEVLSAEDWVDHVAAISFEDATDEQISQITKSIIRVLTTPETASVVFENRNLFLYDNFISTIPIDKREHNAVGGVMEWCIRVQKMGPERTELSAEEFAWVERVVSHPPTLFESLIKEHITHWFQVLDFYKAKDTFEFALSALRATCEISRPENVRAKPSEDEIILISQKCADYPRDENTYRAIGATLYAYRYYKSAKEYLLKAKACSTTAIGTFCTLLGLGRIYYRVRKYESAIKVITRALLLEEVVLSQNPLPEFANTLLRRSYMALARSIQACTPRPLPKESVEKAVRASERAMALCRPDNIDSKVTILDFILDIYRELGDSENIVNRILSADMKLRSQWMIENIEYGGGQLNDFHDAAKKEGRIRDMVKCYEAVMAATSEEGAALLVRVGFASMCWKVLEDEDLAHDELSKILDSKTLSPSGKDARCLAGLLLSEMMYGQIKLAPKVWLKRILTTELSLVAKKDTQTGLDIWRIRPNIALASAFLGSKQPGRAAKLLNSTFSMCLEWLRDDVSWNDSDSLRLLAKTIQCAGFDRDARIAYSACFSELESEDVNKVDAHDKTTDKSDKDDKDDEKSNENEEKSDENEEQNKEKNEENKTENGQFDAGGKGSEIAESKAAELEDAESSNTKCGDTEKGSNELNRLISEGDEDLMPDHSVICDGCQKDFPYFVKDEPLYLCLICRDIDLCKGCYIKRIQANDPNGTDALVTYCGINHDYISAPIEGWGGIKDGVITILREKVEFKHWLKGVEEKWEEWQKSCGDDESINRVEAINKAIDRLVPDS